MSCFKTAPEWRRSRQKIRTTNEYRTRPATSVAVYTFLATMVRWAFVVVVICVSSAQGKRSDTRGRSSIRGARGAPLTTAFTSSWLPESHLPRTPRILRTRWNLRWDNGDDPTTGTVSETLQPMAYLPLQFALEGEMASTNDEYLIQVVVDAVQMILCQQTEFQIVNYNMTNTMYTDQCPLYRNVRRRLLDPDRNEIGDFDSDNSDIAVIEEPGLSGRPFGLGASVLLQMPTVMRSRNSQSGISWTEWTVEYPLLQVSDMFIDQDSSLSAQSGGEGETAPRGVVVAINVAQLALDVSIMEGLFEKYVMHRWQQMVDNGLHHADRMTPPFRASLIGQEVRTFGDFSEANDLESSGEDNSGYLTDHKHFLPLVGAAMLGTSVLIIVFLNMLAISRRKRRLIKDEFENRDQTKLSSPSNVDEMLKMGSTQYTMGSSALDSTDSMSEDRVGLAAQSGDYASHGSDEDYEIRSFCLGTASSSETLDAAFHPNYPVSILRNSYGDRNDNSSASLQVQDLNFIDSLMSSADDTPVPELSSGSGHLVSSSVESSSIILPPQYKLISVHRAYSAGSNLYRRSMSEELSIEEEYAFRPSRRRRRRHRTRTPIHPEPPMRASSDDSSVIIDSVQDKTFVSMIQSPTEPAIEMSLEFVG